MKRKTALGLAAFTTVAAGLGLAIGYNPEAFRSYGTYLLGLVLALAVFLAISRGREIRRQHPRHFN
ncbi:MAG: hypothetical protein O3C43_17600 [Verrucomicrobia bacterium]|nr:hypothetical protein [Verrucomicrobiota bacterium]MDA1068307.1 hypothetical protein [Verrucomicrobiota bacterium]